VYGVEDFAISVENKSEKQGKNTAFFRELSAVGAPFYCITC
jgi:hypothetical protein